MSAYEELASEIERVQATLDGLRDRSTRLLEAVNFIAKENMILRQLVDSDYLTGLPSRYAWEEQVVDVVTSAPPEDNHRTYEPHSFGIIFMDLDNFKKINDTWGHDEGDNVLRQAADRLKLRSHDAAGRAMPTRYGGEEMVIALPWTGLEGALTVAERYRKDIVESVHLPDGRSLTGSFGVAVGDVTDAKRYGMEAVNTIVRKADYAMYEAKRQGRNGVAFYGAEQDIFQIYHPPITPVDDLRA